MNSHRGCAEALILPEKVRKLPSRLGEDYLEALVSNLNLVQQDSDENLFLRMIPEVNPCERIAAYWKLRREVFGDRWLRNIYLVEGEAFTTQDIDAIESGFGVVLPNDNYHRSVVFLDPSRLVDISLVGLKRVIFWLLQRISTNPHTQSDGTVWIIQFTAVAETTILLELIEEMHRSFPAKLHSMHVATRAVKDVRNLPKQVKLHVFSTKTEAREALCSFGLHEKGIPTVFGGKWIFEKSFSSLLAADRLIFSPTPTVERSAGSEKLLHEYIVGRTLGQSGRASPDTAINESSRGYLLSVFEEHIDKLEPEYSQNYRKAKEKCAAMFEVGRECDPELFINLLPGDVASAAKRMCIYWNERADIFGERGFHPLVQSGYGALVDKEIQLLRTGYLSLLPVTESGVTIYVDLARITGNVSVEERLRCFFYVVAAICQEGLSNKTVHGIYSACHNHQYYTRGHSLRLKYLMYHALPLSFGDMDVAYCPETSILSFFDYVLPYSVNLFASLKQWNIRIRIGRTPQDLCKQFIEKGFEKEGLPEKLGGTWSFENFDKWVLARAKVDAMTYPEYDHGHPSLSESGSTLQDLSSHLDRSSRSSLSIHDAFPEDTSITEINRKRRIIYSRRQRKKKKDELEHISKEYSTLKQTNSNLKAEYSRLHMLLNKANECTQEIEASQQRSVFQKLSPFFRG